MAEVAEGLGVTLSTAKARAHRARLLLRQRLGEFMSRRTIYRRSDLLRSMRLPLNCRALYYGEAAHDRSEMAIHRLLAEFGVGGPGDSVVSVAAGPGYETDGFRDG